MENQVTLWFYAGRVRNISDGWQTVNPTELSQIHAKIDEEYQLPGSRFNGEDFLKTDFKELFSEATEIIRQPAVKGTTPVLLILGDLSEDGQEPDSPQLEAGRLWGSVADSANVYILYYGEKNGLNDQVQKWEEQFFTDGVQGALRRIADENRLTQLKNIFEELPTEPIQYESFSKEELQKEICEDSRLCPERVVFAFIRNKRDIEIGAPMATRPAFRVSNYDQGYSLVFEDSLPESQWDLSRKGTENDVLVAIGKFGGFRFGIDPVVVNSDSELHVWAGVFDSEGRIKRTSIHLDWRNQDSPQAAWGAVDPLTTEGATEWIIPVPEVQEDTIYEIQLEANGYTAPIRCAFMVVPRVKMSISDLSVSTTNELTATVGITNGYKLKPQMTGDLILPDVFLSQNGRRIEGEIQFVGDTGGVSEFQVAFSLFDLESIDFDRGQPWSLIANLSGQTLDNITVELSDQRTIHPTPTPVVSTPIVITTTPAPKPTPVIKEVDVPYVPSAPLVLLLIGIVIVGVLVIMIVHRLNIY